MELAKILLTAKSTHLKMMMHSCGSIVEIIDHVIAAGMDILDPIRVSAENMDINAMNIRFGD